MKQKYFGMQKFVHKLEQIDEIVRVKSFVSTELEISEIADRMVKNNGKAILFENNCSKFPVLINAFASDKRLCEALNISDIDEPAREINNIIEKLFEPKNTLKDKLKLLPLLNELSNFFPKKTNRRGICQQVINRQPNLNELPIIKCWTHDAAPFITLPIVHTVNPENNIQNVGMYRMQVLSENETGMHWHLHKNSASHYQIYKKQNKLMPVSVVLGGDPIYTYCASAPLPENINEYLLAGFLRKKKVKLVKCITNDIYVPHDADFVIEGYVDPNEDLVLEGPFGDHTGFYSLADYYPKFHVTCITHKKDAIYPTTIVGIPPQEDKWLGLATERIFLPLIQFAIVPELKDMHMPHEGVFHNIVLANIKKSYPGQANKVMNALWGAGQMMFNKALFIFDEDVNLKNYFELLKIIAQNVNPLTDICFSNGPTDVLDHASTQFAYGSKIGFDATSKNKNKNTFDAEETLMFLNNTKLTYNSILLKLNFPALIISLENKTEIYDLVNAINKNIKNVIHYLIVVDSEVVNMDLSTITWLVANNIDPERDCYFSFNENNMPQLPLIIDGTSKNRQSDFFDRKWPNIVTMNPETIANIDKKWDTLGLGELITSPSLKYLPLVKGNSAVAFE
ncbi:MAG: menaquinone biosynthesis decarboxylase [Bacteroidales bacterium]